MLKGKLLGDAEAAFLKWAVFLKWMGISLVDSNSGRFQLGPDVESDGADQLRKRAPARARR